MMNSDSTIEIIDMSRVPSVAPFLSVELVSHIEKTLKQGKKSMLIYNRRGAGRSWGCDDCGYTPLCPHCDIAFSYHTSPRRQLICHQCNALSPLLHVCPRCHGVNFSAHGIGIQRIEADLSRIFPHSKILRIDSDTREVSGEIFQELELSNIILGTHLISTLSHPDIIHMGFLLFESDLTVPDYRMEEQLYSRISYARKGGQLVTVQTFSPEHPLLSLVQEGNLKDFLEYMSKERQEYHYPPYAELALLRVRDTSKVRVQDIIHKLANKIAIIKDEQIFLSYDRDIWEKYNDEWIQKITLKGPQLTPIIESIRGEIVRNRAVSLEWM